MNPSAAAAIRQKLTSLSRYLTELRGYVEVDLASYLGRPGYRRASERMVQVVVECCIDLAEAIAASAGQPPPATDRAAFTETQTLGAIGSDLTTSFGRRYVGLRNRIVQDYEEIDNAQVHASAKALLSDAAAFSKCITAWVDAQPGAAPG